jgi:anti-sigma B factor antagonist
VVEVRRRGSVATAALVGEFDMPEAEVMQEAFRPLVTDGPTDVSLDLGGVSFFGSCGLNELISLRAAVLRGGGSVRVSDASPTVRRVLEVTGLGAAFNLTPTS